MGVLRARIGGAWVDIPMATSANVDIETIWPAGSIRASISGTADPGWLLFGQTVANAQTLYPTLWGKLPTAWKSGSSMILPSDVDNVLRGSSLAGIGATSGTNTKTIATANLPAHAHTIDHDHAAVESGYFSANHTHGFSTGGISANHVHGGNLMRWMYGSGTTYNGAAGAGVDWMLTNTDYVSADHTHSGTTGTVSANHTHTVDLPNFTGSSGNAGSGTALNVQESGINVRFQIKAH